jgi:PAS domain S-box-containing protein
MLANRPDERVLVLAPIGQDAASMADLLSSHGLLAEVCSSAEECAGKISAGAGALLMTEEALALPGFSGLLESLKAQPPWSELPVIILTSGGESAAVRLLDLTASAAGTVTLLERPMTTNTLWRSVQVAVQSRRRQCQVRDLLDELRRNQCALEDLAHQQQTLYQTADSLARAASMNDVYDSALHSIMSALRCERASLLLSDEAGVMRFRAWHGLSRAYRQAVEGHSPWKPDDPDPQTICIEDIAAAPLEPSLRETIEREEIRALAFLPLQSSGRLLGKFMVYYNQPHRFAPEELRLAKTIACELASGIERKRAEQALLQSEENYRTLVSQVKDYAIFRMDAEGIPISWNEGVERVLGFAKSEFIGKEIVPAIFTPEDLRARVPQQEMETAAAEGSADNDRWMRRKDGTRFYASGTTTGLKDETGKVVGFSKVLRDETEKKQAEEHLELTVAERTADLRASNEQLEAFVYSIAHDLRGPLRSMTGYSQLLIDDFSSSLDPGAQQILRRIQASSEFMDRLLLDLLAYGRAARAELELRPVDLQNAWETALMQHTMQIEQNNALIETVGPLPAVLAHEVTLCQVLANLLSNALKFVPEGVNPHVRFRVEEQGDFVVIWVEDNGIGIPPDQHERAFRVFERLHGSKYTGTGIGLSIVRKGVERMGGQTGIKSAPGEGTRCWIALPKAA